jgi:hypothetical protein
VTTLMASIFLGPDDYDECAPTECLSPDQQLTADIVDEIWLKVIYAIQNSRVIAGRDMVQQRDALRQADASLATVKEILMDPGPVDERERLALARALHAIVIRRGRLTQCRA